MYIVFPNISRLKQNEKHSQKGETQDAVKIYNCTAYPDNPITWGSL